MAFTIADIYDQSIGYEDYLDVNVYMISFDPLDNDGSVKRNYLETHPCSDAELGLDDSKSSKFYPKTE